MLAGEQQELHQIEQGLRDTDRWFAWQLTLLQGLPRRAGSGRRAYLLALTRARGGVAAARRGDGAAAKGACRGGDRDGADGPDGSPRHGMGRLGVRAGAASPRQPGAGPSAAGWHGPVMTTQGSTDGWVRAYRLAALGEDEPVHVGHRPVPGTPAPHWRPPSSRRKYGPDMSTSQCWALVAGQRRDLADARPAGARS